MPYAPALTDPNALAAAMEARSHYVDLRASKDAHYQDSLEWERKAHEALVDALVGQACAGKPARRRSKAVRDRDVAGLLKLLADEALVASIREDVLKEYGPKRDAAWNAYLAAKRALPGIAKDAAILAHPTAPDTMLKVDEVWSSSYASQGFSAEQYAKGSAEMIADRLRLAGIPCVVERYSPADALTGPRVSTSARFLVRAAVWCDVDVELCEHLPAPSLRQQVALSWQRGLNPRVFNPFLPHGYEQSVGLDYQGRDVAPSKGA